MNKLFKLFLLILSTLLIFACNNKNSLVGFPNGTIKHYEVTIPDSCFQLAYSWGDSIRVFSENTKLVIGNYQGIEARTMIKFSSLPTSISNIQNVKIRLKLNKKNLTNSISFGVYKMTKSWSENLATWNINTTDSNWNNAGGDYEATALDIQEFTADADSIVFELPASLITEWVSADSLNKGIMIKQVTRSRDNQFVEFYSSESYNSDLMPQLSFTYTNSSNEEKTYTKSSYTDTFIHNASMITENDNNQLSFWHLSPKAMFFKVDLPWQIFSQADSSITSEEDLRMITINRAELVLTSKGDDLPNTNPKFSVANYVLNSSLAENATYFDKSNYTYYQTTSDTLKAGTLNMNVTALLQAYTSKIKTNYGFVIKSNYQNMDFSRINFYNKNAENPVNRPKIVVKFSSQTKE